MTPSVFYNLLEGWNLLKYWKIFLEHNTALNAPYHNQFHTECVMKNTYLLSVKHLTSPNDGFKEKEKKSRQIKKLLIAALFHDFNHSAGEKSDAENVQKAIKAFLEHSFESEEDNKEIISIIKATQFPYVIDEKDLSLSQQIIRDADMMQMFEPNFFQQIIVGLLHTELKIPTLKGCVDAQMKFMANTHFRTETAKQKFVVEAPKIIEDLKILKNIL